MRGPILDYGMVNTDSPRTAHRTQQCAYLVSGERVGLEVGGLEELFMLVL